MCGIVGIFSYSDQQKTWPKAVIDFMLARIKHRGPDGKDSYVEPGIFLGHTRLAVLDTTVAGTQPMFSCDKRFVISFNGEIYNFREIRDELEQKGYKFISSSDTEVLVNAWVEWGEACLKKLDGIFAFAIFDRKMRSLFLVRDHLGVKPLFYMVCNGQVIFASESLALFNPDNLFPGIDYRDLDIYFTFNYLPAPHTGLKGVRQLEGGRVLTVAHSGIKLNRYWSLEYSADVKRWGPDLIEEFDVLLRRNVTRQLVSDVPLGFFVSGGLDSYAVVSSANMGSKKYPAFTLGFDEPGFDETAAASSYALYLDLPHSIKKFSWNESEIYQALGAIGELLADASCFPLYQLCRFTRQEVSVTVSGDGGDEILAGYDTYLAGELTSLLRILPSSVLNLMQGISSYIPLDNRRYGWRMVAGRLFAAVREGEKRDHATFRRIFNRELKRRLYNPEVLKETEDNDPLGMYVACMEGVPSDRSYLTARQHADLMFHLPSILAKVDRMSMAHGLEVRVPLLSRELVEFCMNLPDDAKRYGLRGKRILREALVRRIPNGALKRPKAGFLPPVDKWFRESQPLINVFGDYLAKAKSSISVLNWNEVEKVWREHREKKIDAGFVLLSILVFINWSLRCRE